MSFYNKVKWVLGILVVFVLIIATNLIDRNNFLQVRDSVISIYEDRLVAKELIFEISNAIQEKELAVAKSDTAFFVERNQQVDKDIQDLVARYELTKLTTEEAKTFAEFKNNLELLKKAESAYMESDFTQKENYIDQISNVKENYYDLSKIQMVEGKRQVWISKKAIDSVELFTQLEIYVLIFLAIVIQIMVIYKPKED